MRSRWLVAFATASACSERTCLFDEFTDEYIAGAEVMDCGDLPNNFPDPLDMAVYRAAHDCAVAANLEQRPFVVRWDVQGIEGVIRRAIVGLSRNGSWEVSLVAGGGSFTARKPEFGRLACASLSDDGDCGDILNLCLRCVEPVKLDACAASFAPD